MKNFCIQMTFEIRDHHFVAYVTPMRWHLKLWNKVSRTVMIHIGPFCFAWIGPLSPARIK